MKKLQQFLHIHPKPAFSEKVQRGDEGKFFKNRPKKSPRLKGPKALSRKFHYPLISMQFKCKDRKGSSRKQRLQKCPNNQVMAVLPRSPKTRIFWKRARGGPREISQKSPKNKPSFERPKSTLAEVALSCNYNTFKVQRLGKILAKKAVQRVPDMPSYGNFGMVTKNPHFLKKFKGETKGNFSKIAQKVALA